MYEVRNNKLVITDAKTGEVKELPLATDKQMHLIRHLEQQLNLPPKKYANLTVWQASTVIGKLSSKRGNNLTLL